MSTNNMTYAPCRFVSRSWLSAVSMMGLLLLSTACATRQIDVVSTPVQVDRPEARPLLPNPQPLQVNPFEWYVLTSKTLPKEDNFVYYGLSPEAYEVLSKNMAEIARWTKEANWLLKYYRGENVDEPGNADDGIGGGKASGK